ANLGAFVKLITERLKHRGCDQVCLGVAGLPSLRDKLRRSHESSLRLFNMFPLKPLSRSDRLNVIHRGLDEAKKKNAFEVTIAEDAEAILSYIAEGYPHFIQQFAYCAFESDTDNHIDGEDVWNGAYGDHGALKQLGLKY